MSDDAGDGMRIVADLLRQKAEIARERDEALARVAALESVLCSVSADIDTLRPGAASPALAAHDADVRAAALRTARRALRLWADQGSLDVAPTLRRAADALVALPLPGDGPAKVTP